MKSRTRMTLLLTATVAALALPAHSFAALPKNSVGAKQLKKNAVTTKKLKKEAVTAAKVKKNSLTGAEINESTLGTVPNADTLDGLHASDFVRVGTAAGSPSGPAGGALAGTYPNPTLNVPGQPCPNGKALLGVTSLAQLICGPGAYIDEFENLSVTPEQFPALEPFAPPGEEQPEGAENTAVGQQALLSLTKGDGNSAFGRGALESNTTEWANSAFGDLALQHNEDGGGNSAFGWEAMINNVSGDENTAVGWAALEKSVSGEFNTAVGSSAMAESTSGNENTGLGAMALGESTGGEKNTAAGSGAMQKSGGGDENSAFGSTALFNNTGSRNSALGQAALGSNATGEQNTALGQGALISNTSGNNNVAVGNGAGHNLTTGNNNIDIGQNVGGEAGESNTIRIGHEGPPNAAERVFLAGVRGVTPSGTPSAVVINENGQLGVTSSSRRFKRDIRPLKSRSNGLMKLRPVSFRYRHSVVHGTTPLQFGLIAEQVAKVYPNLVGRGPDGRPDSIAYQELPALLLAQAQRQQDRISRLQSQVRHQQAQIDWLMRHVRH